MSALVGTDVGLRKIKVYARNIRCRKYVMHGDQISSAFVDKSESKPQTINPSSDVPMFISCEKGKSRNVIHQGVDICHPDPTSCNTLSTGLVISECQRHFLSDYV